MITKNKYLKAVEVIVEYKEQIDNSLKNPDVILIDGISYRDIFLRVCKLNNFSVRLKNLLLPHFTERVELNGTIHPPRFKYISDIDEKSFKRGRNCGEKSWQELRKKIGIKKRLTDTR